MVVTQMLLRIKNKDIDFCGTFVSFNRNGKFLHISFTHKKVVTITDQNGSVTKKLNDALFSGCKSIFIEQNKQRIRRC